MAHERVVMNDAVHKVTAFLTREKEGQRQLLVFVHPVAGTQLPAGTVERDESPEAAVRREVAEETGLDQVEIVAYLGSIENELAAGECVIAQSTPVYLEPDVRALPFRQQLPRGITVVCRERSEHFTRIIYLEHDRYPNPRTVMVQIDGWVLNDYIRFQKTRHYFHLVPLQETPDSWSLLSDGERIYRPFWTPLRPRPTLVPGQDRWLDDVYQRLLHSPQPPARTA